MTTAKKTTEQAETADKQSKQAEMMEKLKALGVMASDDKAKPVEETSPKQQQTSSLSQWFSPRVLVSAAGVAMLAVVILILEQERQEQIAVKPVLEPVISAPVADAPAPFMFTPPMAPPAPSAPVAMPEPQSPVDVQDVQENKSESVPVDTQQAQVTQPIRPPYPPRVYYPAPPYFGYGAYPGYGVDPRTGGNVVPPYYGFHPYGPPPAYGFNPYSRPGNNAFPQPSVNNPR